MISLPEILEVVCEVCRVTEAEVRSHQRRTQPVVDAKHALTYVGRLSGHLTHGIGIFLDLSVNTVNVRHASAVERYEHDKAFRGKVDRIWTVVRHSKGDHLLHARQWLCSCGECADPMSSDWKWSGKTWLHQHEARRKE